MDSNHVIKWYKAISGDEHRFKIVKYLRSHPESSVDTLADELKISKSTLCFHMKKLQQSKIVKTVKRHKFLYYSLNPESFDQILKFIEFIVEKATQNNFKFIFTSEEVYETFALGADRVRYDIFYAIVSNPGISGKQIRIEVKESEADVSFHIEKLIEGNVVVGKKIGNQHYYWPNEGFLLAFLHFLERERKNKK